MCQNIGIQELLLKKVLGKFSFNTGIVKQFRKFQYWAEENFFHKTCIVDHYAAAAIFNQPLHFSYCFLSFLLQLTAEKMNTRKQKVLIAFSSSV